MTCRSLGVLLVLYAMGSWVACGGKAVIAADLGSGGGGAGGTGAGGSTTPTTTTMGCMCSDATGCPSLDPPPQCGELACFDGCNCSMQSFRTGTTCDGGVCDGEGNCVECLTRKDCPVGAQCPDGTCEADVQAACSTICNELEACMVVPPQCMQDCVQGLSQCSPANLGDILACNVILQLECDFDAWNDCALATGCF